MNVPSGMDMNVLMDAACQNQELAAGLMKLFFELTGQEQSRLAGIIAEGNSASASAVAHKIAGSCASCGMSGLAARFRELEHLCKTAIPGDVGERLQAIDREMHEIRLGLEIYFNCSLAP
jgi:HPt (histidine-containing phosphotransfer) domain-containing protein